MIKVLIAFPGCRSRRSLLAALYLYALFVSAALLAAAFMRQLLAQGELGRVPGPLAREPLLPGLAVVLAAQPRPEHLFRTVVAAQQWRDLGVRAKVLVVGGAEQLAEGPNRLLLDLLAEQQVSPGRHQAA